MPKIVVINGLARGGTNLAASLFAAQDGWHASDAALAEITCIDAFLPKDFVNRYPIALGKTAIGASVDSQLEKFKKENSYFPPAPIKPIKGDCLDMGPEEFEKAKQQFRKNT